MSSILEAVYCILNPVEYNRAKNRQAAETMTKGMTLHELVEQCGNPYHLQDGVAEVFLEQIVSRLCYNRSESKKNSFQK